MGEQYRHTLIPRPKDVVPSAANVGRFLAAVIGLGVVPGTPSFVLLTPSGKTKEYTNPFSGEKLVVELKNSRKLANLEEFQNAAAGLTDYEINVSGMGVPATKPLPIDFADPYHVSVTCLVFSTFRSTSDLHEESGDQRTAIPYRKPCPADVDVGLFTDPHTLEVITVPAAGAARFWIQIELGKFLFPRIVGQNLDLLHPAIVEAAEKTFRVSFVQGCYWG